MSTREERTSTAGEDDVQSTLAADEGSSITTTLLTGAAIAIFAPELLPGMAIGVAAVMAPRVLPGLGALVRPLVKTAVRAGYATALTTRELVAEAGEQVQDMVAEARAEQESEAQTARPRRRARPAATKRRGAHA
jgi:hypothetical protein